MILKQELEITESVNDDDDDDWCVMATFVHMVS